MPSARAILPAAVESISYPGLELGRSALFEVSGSGAALLITNATDSRMALLVLEPICGTPVIAPMESRGLILCLIGIALHMGILPILVPTYLSEYHKNRHHFGHSLNLHSPRD